MKCFTGWAALSLLTLIATACFAANDKPLAQSDADYAKLFLVAADLPAGLKNVQDSKNVGPDAKDHRYAELNGQRCGFKVWLDEQGTNPVWRVVDIRMVFPDADSAQKYLNDSLDSLSEGTPEDIDAPKVGDDCHVYGPVSPVAKALGMDMRAYAYVFRKGNVVVKFFVAEGADTKVKLDSKTVADLAQKALKRLEEAGN